MNLQPFYDLRNRLAMTAAAGTQLVQEDFRLREAGKRIEAYEKASPVFAKINQLMHALLEGEEKERTRNLLDILGLLDAFLITQGVSQVEGPLNPVKMVEIKSPEEEKYQNIPYSILYPLKNALTSSGGGRQKMLMEIHEHNPAFLSGYQVRPLLVDAIGDSYGEIADMVCAWIVEIGTPMIPLLKAGFQPEGKKAMVRRVKAISAIAGAEENDFYRENLEKSKQEVREALILALHHHQGNTAILQDLLKTEKGKLRMAVLRSLSFMEEESVIEFWKKYSFSDLENAAVLLGDSQASYVPKLLAREVRKAAVNLMNAEEALKKKRGNSAKEETEKKAQEQLKAANKEKRDTKKAVFIQLLDACCGRMNQEIRETLEWLASEKGLRSYKKNISSVMLETIFSVFQPGEENSEAYIEMAQELFAQQGADFFEPVFAAALIAQKRAEVYETYQDCFEEKSVIKQLFSAGKSCGLNGCGSGVFAVMSRIFYEPERGYYISVKHKTNAIYDQILLEMGERETFYRILEEGIDLRWYTLLIQNWKKCPGSYRVSGSSYTGSDAVLYQLFRKDIPALCDQYGQYFHDRAMDRGPCVTDVTILLDCGWTDFNGFIIQLFQKQKLVAWSYYQRELFKVLPVSEEKIREELEFVRKEREKQNQTKLPLLDRWLEQLQNGASKDELF